MWKASTCMLLSKEPENIELMVVGLGCCQIILGMPWLKTWNPHIDWKSHTLSFPTSPPITIASFPYLVHSPPIVFFSSSSLPVVSSDFYLHRSVLSH